MPGIEIVIFLLVVIVAFSAIVQKFRIPQSIMLVVVGLIIGFTPQLPDLVLDPKVVFLIFLPPLLFAAAFKLSWHDFRAEKRPIISLATGLVFFTTVAVAVVAHYFIPGFSWPLGFVLGAIISPPDAVAATSTTRGLHLNKRIVTILEGESLLNDALALVAYRYAIASVVTGTFAIWDASTQFLWVASAGICIGLAIGWCASWAHDRLQDNATIEVSLTLLTPYVAYLLAEHFHLSGVLAVVAAGLYISYRSPETFSSQARIRSSYIWETIEFLLNGFVFILIGMQLPHIMSNIQQHSMVHAIGYGLLITAVAVVVRILWVFPGAYVPLWLSRKDNRTAGAIDWRYVAVISWTGMRGVVSLASALALPLTLHSGHEFPQREMILFITFCVIFFTLVVQGLSLPLVIRWLRIAPDTQRERAEEDRVRRTIASQALVFIDEHIAHAISDKALARLRSKYDARVHLASSSAAARKPRSNTRLVLAQYAQSQKDVLDFERSLLVQMHKDAAAPNDILKTLEHELDIEEARLTDQIKRMK